MSDAKPVDLAAIRATHARETAHRPDRLGLDGSCVCRCEDCGNARVWLTGQVPAMADDVEALRAGLISAIGVVESCDGAGLFTTTLARLRALLPPSWPPVLLQILRSHEAERPCVNLNIAREELDPVQLPRRAIAIPRIKKRQR